MKPANRILLSCVVASLVMTSGYAGTNYSISDANTTGITLSSDDNLTVTSTGSVTVSSNTTNVPAVDSNSTGFITNSGTISATASGNGNAIGIHAYYNATITNSGTITADIAFKSDYTGTILNTSRGVVNTYKIYASSMDLTNAGTINLHGTQTSYIDTFTQTASGTLSIDANLSANGTATNPTINATHAAAQALNMLPEISAFLPCRLSIYEENGVTVLATIGIEDMLNSVKVDSVFKKHMQKIFNNLHILMNSWQGGHDNA